MPPKTLPPLNDRAREILIAGLSALIEIRCLNLDDALARTEAIAALSREEVRRIKGQLAGEGTA